MNRDLISIIIPIYNVEKYIECGVKSVINQTYQNIEIILVDDGSKDKSSLIIDELEKKDTRIKVIHKANGGVSSARNRGLVESKGKYIVFIDGDDFVENDYIEYLYELIKKGDYDMAFNSKCFDLYNNKRNNNNSYKVYTNTEIIEDIYLGNIGCGVAVWNKIYKKDFLIKNNIIFNEKIWYGEGMLFNIECLKNTQNVIVGQNILYHQVFNPQSAMRSFNLNSNLCGIKSLDIQKTILNTNDKHILSAWFFHKRNFNYSILKGIIKSDSIDKYCNEYKNCVKALRKNVMSIFKVNIGFKKKVKYLLISLNPVYFANRDIKKERQKLKNINNN